MEQRPNDEFNKSDSPEQLLKNMAEAGLSLLAVAKEKIEKAVDDLMDKGKISSEEGSRVMGNFKEEAEKARENFEERAKNITEIILGKLDVPSRKDFKKLKKKVSKLEAAVAALQADKEGEE